jgi:GNAT superfamily N-acetyltransferase
MSRADNVLIDAPTPADLTIIHAELAKTYWAPGIPLETVARAFANSVVALARDERGALIGFARVVTDKATFAWLCDVVVLESLRGKGVARAMVRALMAEPELQGLRRWLLATRDAHGVYAPLGFAPSPAPDRWMEIKNPAPYGAPAG